MKSSHFFEQAVSMPELLQIMHDLGTSAPMVPAVNLPVVLSALKAQG